MENTISYNTSNHPTRIESLDFARTLAITMVVWVHVIEDIYPRTLDDMAILSTQSKIFCYCSYTLGRLGVPIFLFLTGYLLLGQTYETAKDVFTFWKKKLIPLIVTFEFWTVFYEVSIVILGAEFNLVYFLQRIFFMRASYFGHMWYMPMIIGVYFMIPFVSYILNHFSTKLLIIPGSICFIYYFISPALNTLAIAIGSPEFSNTLSLEFTGGVYGLYIFCGYCVMKYHQRLLQFKESHKWSIPVLLLLSGLFYVITVTFQLWSFSREHAYNVAYSFPLLVMSSLSLFIAITVMPDQIPFYNVWKALSVASLGIFFVHNPIIKIITKFDILSLKSMKVIRPIKVIIIFVIAYIISIAIVKVLSRWKKLSRILWLR